MFTEEMFTREYPNWESLPFHEKQISGFAITADVTKGKDFVNGWIERHNGKIPPTFIPPKDFGYSPRHNDLYGSDLGVSASLGLGWRYSKSVIDFDMRIFSTILETPPSEKFPEGWFDKFPTWTTYFPIYPTDYPTETLNADEWVGIFAGLRKIDGVKSIALAFVFKDSIKCMKINLVPTDIPGLVSLDPIPETKSFNSKELASFKDLMSRAATALGFICSLIPHNPEFPKPDSRLTKKKKKIFTLLPTTKPTRIDLRVETERYLSGCGTTSDEIERVSRKAHIRRAHWHGYWLGPRDGDQTFELKWIPPTFVAGSVAE